jgi:hypothetical protein
MKASENDTIETTVDVTGEFSDVVIPAGTKGVVVESYSTPEGYAVDLAIPAPGLVGDYAYENVILRPDQFTVVPA